MARFYIKEPHVHQKGGMGGGEHNCRYLKSSLLNRDETYTFGKKIEFSIQTYKLLCINVNKS